MAWLTTQMFIQILLTIIMFSVGWNLRIMVQSFSKSMETINKQLNIHSEILIKHISNHDIHAGG